MAFRATHKTAPKKSSKKAEVTDVPLSDFVEAPKESVSSEPVSSLSVEDFVGAPVGEKPKEKTKEVTPVAAPASVAPVREPLPETNRYSRPPVGRMDRPRTGYSTQGAPAVGRDRGGYNRGYQGGGGYRRPYNSPRSASDRYGRDGFGGEASHGGRFNRGNFGSEYRREWAPSTPAEAAPIPDVNVPTETVRGILDSMPEGHGFLRPKFTPSDRDVYISQSQIRRFMLRNGDMVEGQARQPKDNERYWGLLKVEKVNEELAETMATRAHFDDLTAIYPNKQLKLESNQTTLSTRIIDLVAPIGFGQRALIVSPPKAGKTTILKELAAGITANYPEVHLMAALIGERPEEVTDLTRSIKGEVLASNFDESPPDQTRVAEVALDRAKRLVEMGKDVVVLLDSITRLARAYNLVVNPSGRTLSGGFDPAALYPAKKFLGAARCVEGPDGKMKGSLTVIGTALVDTGSRMDDLIYEEFKGTGNMELTLSRALEERRVFPAIDVGKSGTRHDELLLGEDMMKKVTTLRHMLSLLSDEERTMMLVDRLSKTKTNEEFLESLSKGD